MTNTSREERAEPRLSSRIKIYSMLSLVYRVYIRDMVINICVHNQTVPTSNNIFLFNEPQIL